MKKQSVKTSSKKIVHELKTWTEYFSEIAKGNKTFEVRFNDRSFFIGDIIILKEYCPNTEQYSWRIFEAEITYLLRGEHLGIQAGYVVIGFKKI